VAGSFEHGNETSGSVKCGEFLDQLSSYHLLKNNAAAWMKNCKIINPFQRGRDNVLLVLSYRDLKAYGGRGEEKIPCLGFCPVTADFCNRVMSTERFHLCFSLWKRQRNDTCTENILSVNLAMRDCMKKKRQREREEGSERQSRQLRT